MHTYNLGNQQYYCDGSSTATIGMTDSEPDMVNHPLHYNAHPTGIECIDIVEHMNFNLGNAIKYIWREALKANSEEDLKKAIWYINREIERRKKYGESTGAVPAATGAGDSPNGDSDSRS